MNFQFQRHIASLLIMAVLAPMFFVFPLAERAEAAVPVFQTRVVDTAEVYQARSSIYGKEYGMLGGAVSTAISSVFNFLGEALSSIPIIGGIIGSIAPHPGDPDVYVLLKTTIMIVLMQFFITWVQTGDFTGGPLFILNFEDWLTNAISDAGGIFLAEFLDPQILNMLCSPFRLPMANLYSRRAQLNFNMPHARCSIERIIGNINNLYDSIAVGGGVELYAVTFLSPENNFFGTDIITSDRLLFLQHQKQRDAENQARSNSGYIGQRECLWWADTNQTICGQYLTETPGKSVQDQIAAVTGQDLRTLGVSDEIVEMLGSAFGALLSQGIAGGMGLLGNAFSAPPSSAAPPGLPPPYAQAAYPPPYAQSAYAGPPPPPPPPPPPAPYSQSAYAAYAQSAYAAYAQSAYGGAPPPPPPPPPPP